MATRTQLLRLEAQGANFEREGYFALPDWRYELLVDYLKVSPTYQAICKSKGKSIKDPPKDWAKVVKTYVDFKNVFEIKEQLWWREVGMALFGIQAKKSESFVIGNYSKNEFLTNESIKSATNTWGKMANPEMLALAIPKNQTKQQALKQVTTLIRSMDFASNKEIKVKPKYKLASSKLQKTTLAIGPAALRLYRSGVPLREIGYKLKLSASSCKDIDQNNEVAEAKRYLQILASKLIHKAENIAENAARGVFPCDKPLKTGIPRAARKVGRPKSK